MCSAINQCHLFCTKPFCLSCCVDGRHAQANDRYTVAHGNSRKRFSPDVVDETNGVYDAFELFTRNIQLPCYTYANAQVDRIELLLQIADVDIVSKLLIILYRDPPNGSDVVYLLLTKLWGDFVSSDAISHQSATAVFLFKNGHIDAFARKHVRAAQPRRASPNNSHFFSRRWFSFEEFPFCFHCLFRGISLKPCDRNGRFFKEVKHARSLTQFFYRAYSCTSSPHDI